jgi:hypothetical protein
LRALWQGLLKSNAALAALRPVIAVKERSNGLGMQLRLLAGPLSDAATAANICAALKEADRTCETTVFDGQRLAMKADEGAASALRPAAAAKPDAGKPDAAKPEAAKPDTGKSASHRRSTARRAVHDEPAKKPDPPSTLSSLFGRR